MGSDPSLFPPQIVAHLALWCQAAAGGPPRTRSLPQLLRPPSPSDAANPYQPTPKASSPSSRSPAPRSGKSVGRAGRQSVSQSVTHWVPCLRCHDFTGAKFNTIIFLPSPFCQPRLVSRLSSRLVSSLPSHSLASRLLSSARLVDSTCPRPSTDTAPFQHLVLISSAHRQSEPTASSSHRHHPRR